jgi:hypothetical protein
MANPTTPLSDEALIATVEHALADVRDARQTALAQTAVLDAERATLGHHPHYTAYVHGGMLAERGFGPQHILAVLGFHTLDWREALARMAASASASPDDEEADLLGRLHRVCASDPMLEVAGERLLLDLGLLKHGGIDPFWLKRPKLGLGQAAKMFGLAPGHADGHRGLYDLTAAALRRLFDDAATGQPDQRFGALLLPIIIAGGAPLAASGAAAFHRDAETRYRDDCRRFAEHQRREPSRRWRWKPALSRQGHLAVTTARQTGVAVPAERTRGHAANWLADHDANLRFNGKDEA